MPASLWPALWIAGVVVPWFSPVQPGWHWLMPLLLLVLVWPAGRAALLVLGCGVAFSLFEVDQLREHQVPDRPGGYDLLVEGEILSRPVRTGNTLRFDLQLLQPAVQVGDSADDAYPQANPRKLRISWYLDAPDLVRGQIIKAEIRARAPRGLLNEGLFDYGSWLVSRGYDGSGYVRQLVWLQEAPQQTALLAWREQIEAWVLSQPWLAHSDLLLALGIGEQRYISDSRWDQLEQWGLIHLMVISGLHIGFAAALGQWLASPLARTLALVTRCGTARDWSALAGLAVAAVYAALAGFTLPTKRALAAVVLWYLLGWLRWRLSPLTLFCWLLALILAVTPRVAIQPTLWMSFGAVFVLLLAMQGVKTRGLLVLIRVQLALFIAFSGLLLLLGKSVYPLGAVYNLIAVPVAGLLLVPLLLFSLLLHWAHAGAAGFGLYLVDQAMSVLFSLLGGIGPDQPVFLAAANVKPLQAIALVVAGLAFCWLRHGLLLLPWLIVLAGIIRLPDASQVALEIRVFDVGQGTALLVRQPGYSLLYDTGPAFPSGFNAGEDILLPWMRANRVQLDALMVSHNDRDHSGGYEPIWRQFKPPLQLGGPGTQLQGVSRNCQAGQSWQVRDVTYHVLHPLPGSQGKDNDLSCVLLLQWRDRNILLTGDIERSAELELLQRFSQPVDWVLVPHHGSRTSSTAAFVQALRPAIAVVTAGWGNSYGHPVDEVLQRYAQIGTRIESTAVSGMLVFQWLEDSGELLLTRQRQQSFLWWMKPSGEVICSADNSCGRRYDR